MLLAGEQVIILYLIAAVGFVADKVGFFPEKTAKNCRPSGRSSFRIPPPA